MEHTRAEGKARPGLAKPGEKPGGACGGSCKRSYFEMDPTAPRERGLEEEAEEDVRIAPPE